MFSPALAGPPAASVRSSRRRQRLASNDDSIAPPSKRQRSALSEQTFIEPDGNPEMKEVKNAKFAIIPSEEVARAVQGPQREIAVRSKKSKGGDRGVKGDGGLLLTRNDTYTVNKLPALPDRLRNDHTIRQHGAIYSEYGYALAITRSHAIVWPYAANMQSPETFTFALPYPSKHASDPLSLGSLVSASASASEPGIVVVAPTTGKITYWESITSATTLDLIRQQRNGVEASIPGMLSGETVTNIVNAESAGFVLGFTSGRAAYVNVRDGQGRPAISVQFLRNNSAPISSGMFGSIRKALTTSPWSGDIAAIRAGPPFKVGERDVVIATARGRLHGWTVHRGGHNTLRAEAEGREALYKMISETEPACEEMPLESLEVLDFTYTPKSIANTQLSHQGSDGDHLLLLISLKTHHKSYYFLAELVLKPDKLVVESVRTIKSYTTPINKTATSKTRLYLPNPALVAYIVFDRAVVVMSMAKQPESPDSQLRMESDIQPQHFEDVVDFREDSNVEIMGSGMEEPHGSSHGIEDSKSRRSKAKHASVVLLVRGGGILRVAAIDTAKLISAEGQQITAKSKLEQAVFFGKVEKTPLSFAVRQELRFAAREVGEAALELSQEILKSRNQNIPFTAFIDQNLRQRAGALHTLAEYLKETNMELDRVTRWKLLWDAEKMSAAILIWEQYDAQLRIRASNQKRGLLAEVIEFIDESLKTEPITEAGEVDRVRHWFLHDIWNLEIALPWAYQAIKYFYFDGQKEHEYVMEMLVQANEMVMGALATAFDFRATNLDLYGLQADEMDCGILQTGYEGLPEFWTSTYFIVENSRKQYEMAATFVEHYWDKQNPSDNNQANDIRMQYPTLLDVSIRVKTERLRWAKVQDDPQLQIQADDLENTQAASLDDHLRYLAEYMDLSDDAMDLAEKYRNLPVLAFVLVYEIGLLAIKFRARSMGPKTFYGNGGRLVELQNRLRHCFEKFGSPWATALYERYIASKSMTELLEDYQDQQAYLTSFLRSKPEYAKVAWIQEVIREGNFDRASRTLLDLGLNREQNLWSKKIELSLAKLASMVGRDVHDDGAVLLPAGAETEVITANAQLALINIQDQVYKYVLSSIGTALDESAELELAREAHGDVQLKAHRALGALFEEALSHLIKHEAMNALTLIDLLTLMCHNGISQDGRIFIDQQFYLAIEASRYMQSSKEDQTMIRVIWRRCLLRDNWKEVNNTDLKDDQSVSERLRNTVLYTTIKACLKNRIYGTVSVEPRSIEGACTQQLDHRFDGVESSIKESILRDMRAEDKSIQSLFKSSRLEKWYQAASDLARKDFEHEVNEETDDGEIMRSVAEDLADIEKEIADNEKQEVEHLLYAKPKSKPKRRMSANMGSLRGLMK